MSMQGKTYKNYEEFSIAFDNTPEEVLRSETYTLLKAYNRAEQDKQQYKQQIEELEKEINRIWNLDEVDFYFKKYERLLSKLKERNVR